MNAKHPIDELFARGLSDAEASPPPEVWQGIVRQRGWGHRTLLQLQRRWGVLSLLLLLLGGSVAGWIYAANSTPQASVATTPSATHAPVATPSASASTISTTTEEIAENASPETNTEAATATTTATKSTRNNGTPSEHRQATIHSSSPSRTTDPEIAEHTKVKTSTSVKTPERTINEGPHANVVVTLGVTTEAPSSSPKNDGSATKHESTATTEHTTTSPSAGTTQANKTEGSLPLLAAAMNTPERVAPSTSLESGTPTWLPARPIGLEPVLIAAEAAKGGTLVPYKQRKGLWSAGITGGFYSEERSWKGNDLELVDALNSTETPHYPYSVGLTLGREWHSGLNLLIGFDYAVARFDLTRTERTQEWTPTNTPAFVVLLDTMIVAYQSDTTILTLTETLRETNTRNTVTSFRIPLELGYSIDWRRWSFGLRAGPVAEFITSRSGLTLELQTGDSTSVQSIQVDKQRKSTIISGSVTPWIGFKLSEHWRIAAEGVYMRGFGELGASDAYVLPDRMGARLHLSYTLPFKR